MLRRGIYYESTQFVAVDGRLGCCLDWDSAETHTQPPQSEASPSWPVAELQVWFMDRFYVDLPVDRYKDMVDVDWAAAQEWDNLYVAECRVRPGPAQPWEKFRMKRDG